MVWEQRAAVIVMLTHTDDNEACRYWPSRGESEEFGGTQVMLDSVRSELGGCSPRLFLFNVWVGSCPPLLDCSTVFSSTCRRVRCSDMWYLDIHLL
jgi:hypothetical protein